MYRTALKQDRRYGQAYYRNALALIRMSQMGPAEASLRRALELLPEGPERVASRVQLADIYLAYMEAVKRDRHLTEEVDRLCDELLALNPDSFNGHRLRGTLSNLKAAELSGKYPAESADEIKKAIRDLRAADAIREYKPEVVSALARALWANNQPAEAEKYLKGILRAQPSFAAGYSELKRYYMKNNRLKDAEALLLNAAEYAPRHYEFLSQLAELYQQTGRLADMAKTLERLKKEASNSPAAAYEMSGRLFLKAGEPQQAIREFEEGIRRYPKGKLVFQKLIVDALMAGNKTEDALKLNDQILHEHPDDADALARQADYFLRSGDAAKAIVKLEAILRRAPNHPLTHYNLGRALLIARRQEDARVHFSEAIRWAPDFIPPRIALTKVELGAGEFGLAVASADAVLDIDFKHAEARVLRAIALRGLGKLGAARAEINNLLAMYPRYDEALFQLGQVNAAERRWKEAEAAYRKSYEVNSANIQGLLTIADYKMEHHQADQAIEILAGEVRKHPERLDLRLAHGALASRGGRRDEAVAEYQLLLTKLERNPKALGDINLRLGELYFRTGAIQESLEYLETARQLRPDDAGALHSLGVVYDKLGRKKEAAALYAASLKIDGQNPVVLNNLAYYISQNGGDLDEALTFAQRARQSSPHELEYSDTVAYIYLKKNLLENAIEILEDLISKKPTAAVFRIHLAEALLKKGETARAKKELQAALSSKPSREEAAKIRELLGKDGV